MKIDVTDDGVIRLRNVFNSIIFETDDGEELVVCMRDGHFEIAVRDLTARDQTGGNEKYYSWYTACSAGIITQQTSSDCCKPTSDTGTEPC